MAKHKIGEVWKESPAFSKDGAWKVQMPLGVLTYSTKRQAMEVAAIVLKKQAGE